jgi:mannose-6-phosphate isomerase-like protein (cupin superfamily)
MEIIRNKENCYMLYDADILCKALVTIASDTFAERTLLTKTSGKPVVVHEIQRQLTLCLKGNGIAILNKEPIAMHAGQVLLIYENVTHAFVAESVEWDLYHWHLRKQSDDYDRYVINEAFEIAQPHGIEEC